MAQYHFGDCTLDEKAPELQRDGVRVDIEPAAMAMLLLLVHAGGATVTYEQLAGRDRINDSDRHAANSCANRLRQAIGEVRPGEFVENVRKTGYRFRMSRLVQDVARPVPGLAGRSDELLLHVEPEAAVDALQRVAEELPPYVPPRLRSASVQRLTERYTTGPFAETIAKMDGEVLRRHDGAETITYPVVVFPAVPGQALDSVLPADHVDSRQSAAARPADMAVRDPFPRLHRWVTGHPDKSFEEALKATSTGWNLCMTSLERHPATRQLALRARLGEYGLILDTCDALIDETFLGDVDAPWPLREAIESRENPFAFAMHRAAGIGIAALITVVEREPNGSHVLHALVGRRSKDVGTYQDTWHVVPAGMFNYRFGSRLPHRDDLVRSGAYDSGDILRSVLTEYAEEARNVDKMEANTNRTVVDRLDVVQDLVRVARFEFTGVAIDLANLRPEICVLIYISDPGWHGQQEFELNYEYGLDPAPVGRERQAGEKRTLTAISVARDGRPLDDALDILKPDETVAAGAAAFWLGVDRAREIFKDELGQYAST